MGGQKIQLRKPHRGWSNRKLKIFGLFLASISFFNLAFSNKTFALFTPTLSASIDQTAASVNGNQVINSTNRTTEVPLNLTVNTNNKSGYTATLNSETDETALVNSDSTNGAKINSISSASILSNFSNNSWGYKFGSSTNYVPIPALSTPTQILQTAGKTNGSESNQLSIGMKLSDNLESGRYTNKLIFSIVTNNYEYIALMTEGADFNAKLKALETATNKIKYFKKSTVAPAASMDAVNIEDEKSDYEIKLWLNPTDKTAYYYAEPEKVYLNTDSSKMFFSEPSEQKIRNILKLDLSSFDTSKVTNMGYMFYNISNPATLDLSNFDTSHVTDMGAMFAYMTSLFTLDLSNFDTSQVTDMGSMFARVSSLITLDLSSFDTSQVRSMHSMFSAMFNLTTLNLSHFDTSKVTDMAGMFYSVSTLRTLNLSNFDTSQVTDMNHMFYNMSNLTTLNLSSFDTSKVTNMGYMFAGVSNITTLNLTSFDTSKVTNMGYMFSAMFSLTTLNLSNFDTSQVTNMGSMFAYMRNLTTLNLSNFDTSKVTDMSRMFSGISNLTTIDLSNFNTSNVTDISYMFSLDDGDVDKLERIYVNNDFNTTKLTNFYRMFENRKKLRGGNGSFLANPSTADKSWLRIDDPTNGRPGYFTRKP